MKSLSKTLLLVATLVGRGSATMSCDDAPPASQVRDYISGNLGAFNVSMLDTLGEAFTPLLYRQREETFRNRTTQLRHGSQLRPLEVGKPLDINPYTNDSCGASVDQFMHKYGWTGFIVVHEGRVRLEEYRHGNIHASRHDIQSVTKSVMTTVLGIAQREGKLSVNDPVSHHVRELVGTAWQDVPLLALANMVSGVIATSDTPDMDNDIYPQSNPNAVIDWLKTFKKIAEPWEKFNYFNPNFYLLATSIARATNQSIEGYITSNIWEPAGMQYDGYIRTTGAGQVDGHGGLSVTLTDMARLGLFILDGLEGKEGPAVPAGWFTSISEADNSTGVRAPGAISEAPTFGYQTGWWTPRRGSGSSYHLGDDKAFTALGMYGQVLYVIPGLKAVVAAQTGYPIHDATLSVETEKFVTAIAQALKKEQSVASVGERGEKLPRADQIHACLLSCLPAEPGHYPSYLEST